MNLIRYIKKIIPEKLLRRTKSLKMNAIALFCFVRNKRNLCAIAGKRDVYNVLFFLESSSLWKYNNLYRLMQKSMHFNPIIIVCPNIKKDRDEMLRGMCDTYAEMCSNGYSTIMGYDVFKKEYVDIRALDPHIIFFTNSWEQYLDERFHIERYNDVLTCYINYSFVTTPHKWSFVTNVSTRVWRYFQECDAYNKILRQWTLGINTIVTGYTIYDEFLNTEAIGKDWKQKNCATLKRVIYAPHHSIPQIADGIIPLSTFLIHAETMLEIADEYKDKIQFVFKPHPHLRNNLYKHPDWGVEKTDKYYNSWKDGENTAFVNGEYIDLFKSSDALIHDCSSFTIEYLYTKKPVCFLSNIGHDGQANEVALRAYDTHYKAKTKADICNFIDNVILGDVDEKRVERENFYNDVLLPPNGCNASENIINELKKSLKIHENII